MSYSVKEFSIHFGIAVGVIAILGAGYGVGRNSKTDMVERLELDIDQLKSSNQILASENESLRARILSTSGESVEVIPPASISGNPSSSNNDQKPIIQTIRVPRQQTASFFDGELEITTVAIEYSGSPLVHRVTFSVLIPGASAQKFEQVDPGFDTKVGLYQVVVIETETFSATYKVFKLEKNVTSVVADEL